LATSLGGAVTISFIGLIYRDGSFFIAAGIAFILGLMMYRALIPFMFEAFQTSSEINSLDDYLSAGQSFPMAAISVVNAAIYFLLALAQFTSVFLLLKVLGIAYAPQFLFLTIVLVTVYLLYGVAGVFVTEKIQTIAICAWLASLLIFVISSFDIETILLLEPSYLTGLSKGPWLLVAVLVLFPWTAIARADLWQRTMSSKSAADGRGAISALMLVMFCIYVLMGLVGITLYSINPNLTDYNIAAFQVLDGINEAWIGLAVVGIFAALISSADSMLNLASISIFNFIRVFDRRCDDSFLVWHSVVLGGLALLSFTLVLFEVDLGSIVILASTASSILVPTLILTVFSKFDHSTAKFLSVSAGAITAVVALLFTEDPTIVFVPATILASIGLVVGVKSDALQRKNRTLEKKDAGK
tara:strand:- start:6034 stop:7275 length:1242 start_codon:yes stop_codon:yes gene_type:complete